MKFTSERWLLGIALILTLSATFYLYMKDQETQAEPIEPVEFVNSGSLSTNSDQTTTQELPHTVNNRFLEEVTQDIFSTYGKDEEMPEETQINFPTAPLVITESPPPPLPSAPPIPFNYIGKYMEDNELVVFLGYRGKNLIVKAGDVIQQTYKVEEIKPPILVMTYIPMEIKQSIQIGELQ